MDEMSERGPPVTVTHRPGRLTRGLLALVAGLAIVVAGAAHARAATVAAQLGTLPTIQPFNGEATSRSQFNTRWGVFNLAWEAAAKGSDTASGWSSDNAYPNANGAYYVTTSYTAVFGGAAAAATLNVAPTTNDRWFALWADARNEALDTMSGYELRFTYIGEEEEELYDVTLTKWVAGARTVLARRSGYTFPTGSSLAIVDEGGTVSGWTSTGAGFTQLLSASDAAFNSGSVGLGAADNATSLSTFKAGQLAPATPTITGTNPASPSDDAAPFVIGTAVSGTTVKLYTDASCRGTVAGRGTAAAFASSGIQVRVAEGAVTNIYATASDNLEVASDCSRAVTYTQDPTIGIATALAGLTQLDAFGTAENPLSGGGRWSRLAWASNTGRVGSGGTSGGWTAANAYPTVSGAYWNPSTFSDTGRGVAVAGTLSVGSEITGRWFSVWLDMSSPGSAQSGYELRFTYSGEEEEEDLYDVTLTKWTSGSRTVLASRSEYTLATQSSFALVDKGGNVYAWIDTGGGYTQLLAARDATYSSGYAGIEGAGNITRVRQFRAGAL
jgi:hypothetical protein